MPTLQRKIWTREESNALVGVIPDAEKLELIEGELIARMGKKPPHVFWLRLINEWLREVFGWRFVRTEQPIRLNGVDGNMSEPEPDLAVTSDPMRGMEPVLASTLRLVIEVSHSTLDMDLKVKSRLYARSNVVEYWVIDVERERVFIHRNPVDGEYGFVEAHAADKMLHTLAAPHIGFRLSSLPTKYLTD